MNQSLTIEGKNFISSRRAAEITKYSNDYVGQLCRTGKVNAKRVGRVWFVEEQSIVEHKKISEQQLVQNGYASRAHTNAPHPKQVKEVQNKNLSEDKNILNKEAEKNLSNNHAPGNVEHRLNFTSRPGVHKPAPKAPLPEPKHWRDINGYIHDLPQKQIPTLAYEAVGGDLLPILKKSEAKDTTKVSITSGSIIQNKKNATEIKSPLQIKPQAQIKRSRVSEMPLKWGISHKVAVGAAVLFLVLGLGGLSQATLAQFGISPLRLAHHTINSLYSGILADAGSAISGSLASTITYGVSHSPFAENELEGDSMAATVIDSLSNGWNSVKGIVRNGVRRFLGIKEYEPVAESAVSNATTTITSVAVVNNIGQTGQNSTTIIEKPIVTTINTVDSSVLERILRVEQNLAAFQDFQKRQDYAIMDNIGQGGSVTTNIDTNPLRLSYILQTADTASQLTYASTTAISVSGIASTTGLVISGLANGNDRCLQVDASGNVTAINASCGSAGGASSTWSTTTSSVLAQNINYSINDTDIVTIGGSSTSTAKFFFDPNTQKAFFSGSVGIGITSPTARLDIYSTDSSNLFTKIKGNNSGFATYQQLEADGSFFGQTIIYGSAVSGTRFGINKANMAGFLTSSDSAVYGNSYAAGFTSLVSGGAEAVRIDTNRNVGIGTTSPMAKLAINNFNGGVQPQFVIASSTGSSATSTSFIVDRFGNVGIGTASPVAPLQISSNLNPLSNLGVISNYQSLLMNTSGTLGESVGIAFGVSTANIVGASIYHVRQGSSSIGDLAFATRNSVSGVTEKMRITDAGNVGIGTTSPYAKLSVVGPVAAEYFHATSTTATSTFAGGLNVAGTAGLTVLQNGKVGIGTVSPTNEFEVQGNVRIHPGSDITNGSTVITTSGTNSEILMRNSGGTTGTYLRASGVSYFNGGNVGIGSTSPFAKLSVKGGGTTTGVNFQTTDSNNSALFTVLDNGNIGIGVSNPTVSLAVAGASPTIAFTDTNATAFISQSNGTSGSITMRGGGSLAFQTYVGGWQDRLNITNGGNVGIGTTTPSTKLSITDTTNPIITMERNDTTVTADELVGGFTTLQNDTNYPTEFGSLLIRATNAITASTNANSYMAFSTANIGAVTERMRLTNVGYLGIGTTSPRSHLNISSNVNNGSIITLENINTNIQPSNLLGALYFYGNDNTSGTADGIRAKIVASTTGTTGQTDLVFGAAGDRGGGYNIDAATEIMRLVGTTGNVGIGTTTPSGNLDVYGANPGRFFSYKVPTLTLQSNNDSSSNSVLNLVNTQNGVDYGVSMNFNLGYGGLPNILGTAINAGAIRVNAENDWTSTVSTQDASMKFLTALNGVATEKMRITSDGNVGIGTTSPGLKLEVSGVSSLPATSGTTQTGIARFSSGNAGLTSVLDVGSYNTTGAGWIQVTDKLNLALSRSLLLNPNGGTVGIGTTSPVANLHVYAGTSASTKEIIEGGNGSTWSSELDIQKNFQNNSYAAINFGVNGGGQQWYAGLLNSGTSGRKNFSISPDTTDSSAYFTVTNTGNVGIGTTSPLSDLHVEGGILTLGNYGTNAGIINAPRSVVINIDSNNDQTDRYFGIQNNAADGSGTSLLRILENGNVGIGTTSPSANLEIYRDSATASLSLDSTNIAGQNAIFFKLNGVTKSQITSNFSDNNLYFFHGGNRMVINSITGNVGIGTTTPASALNVVGAVGAGEPARFAGNNSTGGFITMVDAWNTFTTRGYLGYGSALFTNGAISDFGLRSSAGMAFTSGGPTVRMYIDSTGNVGIGTTSPGAKLEVVGDMILSDATPLFTLRDTDGPTDSIVLNGNRTANSLSFDSSSSGTNQIDFKEVGNAYFRILHDGSSASPNNLLKIQTADGADGVIDVTAVTIQQNGNVGIGTTSPESKLQISDGGYSMYFGGSGLGTGANIFASTTLYLGTKTGNSLFLETNDTTRLQIGVTGDINFNSGQAFIQNSTGNMGIGTTSPMAKLAINNFNGGVQPQFVIASSTGSSATSTSFIVDRFGNVGIGTTAPGYKLQIGNGVDSTHTLFKVDGLYSDVTFAGDHTPGPIWDFTNTGTGAGTRFYVQDANNLADRLTFDFRGNGGSNLIMAGTSAGNVGIGTTTPAVKLDVYSNGFSQGNITGYDSQQAGGFRVLNNAGSYTALETTGTANADNPNVGILYTGLNKLQFGRTRSDVKVTIDNTTGNVGIGTSTPDKKFQIYDATTGTTASIRNAVGNGNGASLMVGTSRGTAAAPTDIANGDTIGTYGTEAFSGGSWFNTASMSTLVDGTFTSGQRPPSALTFSTNNANNSLIERMRITSAGNVGIGTTSPSSLLELAGTNGSNVFTLRNTATVISDSVNPILGEIKFAGNDKVASEGGVGAKIGAYAESNWPASTNYYPSYLSFFTNPASATDITERMRITSAGNVGIGTTSPYAKLSVVGEVVAPYYTATSTTATSTFAGGMNVAGSSGLTVLQNGKVGIAKMNPAEMLDVYGNIRMSNIGSSNEGLKALSLSGTNIFSLTRQESPSVGSVSLSAYGNIGFVAGATGGPSSSYQMLISSSGNVGIGTTTPDSALNVNGNVVIGVKSGSGAILTIQRGGGNLPAFKYDGTSGSVYGASGYMNWQPYDFANANNTFVVSHPSVGNFIWRTGVTTGSDTTVLPEIMRLTYAGNLGIGTTSPWGRLSVTGAGATSATYGLVVADSNDSPKMVVRNDGNVGIGTSTPFAKLSVFTSTSTDPTTVFAIGSTTAAYATTTLFSVENTGVFTFNHANATSTINGNLYVNGTLRSNLSYVGDLFFANNFSFKEAPFGNGATTTQGLVLKNQKGVPVITFDEFGNIEAAGDICSRNNNCYGRTISLLTDALNELGTTTKNLELGIMSIDGNTASTTNTIQGLAAAFEILNAKVELLAATSTMASTSELIAQSLTENPRFLASLSSTTAAAIASSTAAELAHGATSISFIQQVALAVRDSIQAMGEWVVEKITAKNIASERVETQTASVSNGLEMKDQATGQVYCVTILNGDWHKQAGSCAAQSAATSSPVAVPVVSPSTQPAPVVSTSPSPSAVPLTSVATTTTATATTTTSAVSTTTSTQNPAPSTASSTSPSPSVSPSVSVSPTPTADTSITPEPVVSTQPAAPATSVTPTVAPSASPSEAPTAPVTQAAPAPTVSDAAAAP